MLNEILRLLITFGIAVAYCNQYDVKTNKAIFWGWSIVIALVIGLFVSYIVTLPPTVDCGDFNQGSCVPIVANPIITNPVSRVVLNIVVFYIGALVTLVYKTKHK